MAVVKLLNRSSIHSIPNHVIARNLSTSIQLFEKQENKKENSESNKDQPEKNSSNENKPNEDGNKQSNKNEDEKRKKDKKSIDDKDRENNTNKTIAYMTKTILWLALIYSISFTIIVVSSILRGGSVGKGDVENYSVSWKEFVQYMLAAGEVKEIIVRPQYDYVRIVLHEGAIVNGRRPRFSSYMLTVPNVERFEQRLREVEKSMGIADGKINLIDRHIFHILMESLIEFISGVSIRYERFSELYLKLFAGAIACAILYAILKRLPNAASASRQNYVSIRFTCKFRFTRTLL